jgi:hypothetical protein
MQSSCIKHSGARRLIVLILLSLHLAFPGDNALCTCLGSLDGANQGAEASNRLRFGRSDYANVNTT